MHTKSEIHTVVEEYIRAHVNLDELDENMNIFSTKLVNSLFAIELMTFLEKSFNIKVGMDDLDMSYFESINAIITFVMRKEAEKLR